MLLQQCARALFELRLHWNKWERNILVPACARARTILLISYFSFYIWMNRLLAYSWSGKHLGGRLLERVLYSCTYIRLFFHTFSVLALLGNPGNLSFWIFYLSFCESLLSKSRRILDENDLSLRKIGLSFGKNGQNLSFLRT